MKFVFLAADCTPFHANSLEERPMGGTVTGVIRLSQCLQKLGHEVIVATLYENPPPSKPKYIHISQLDAVQPSDVFIIIRDWRYVLPPTIICKKRFFWTGDS